MRIFVTIKHPAHVHLFNSIIWDLEETEPHQIHHVLRFTDFYFVDLQMATEASLLGTPAGRFSPWAAKTDMSNFVELEEKYGLLFSTADGQQAFQRIKELLAVDGLQEEWNNKREHLLEEKIDVTEFVVDLIEEIGSR